MNSFVTLGLFKDLCEINGPVSTVKLFTTGIRMEFGIKKCGMLIIERGKTVSSDGVERLNSENIEDIWTNGPMYMNI